MVHRMTWTAALVLALAVPASAAGIRGGEEPHYNGWDLDRKFREIDQKLRGVRSLRQIQDQHRAGMRRIVDIEATLRELRTSVKALERRLDSIDSALTSLQKELVAVRERAPKGVTPEEPGKTGDEAEPKPEGPVAEIINVRSTSDAGFRTITGLVQNRTDRPLSFVVVQATFLDGRGSTIKTESTYTNPRVIGPHARGAFKIYSRADRRVRRHRLTVQAK